MGSNNSINYICSLAYGLHARPAKEMAHFFKKFSGDVTIVNDRNKHQANAKSILSLISLDLVADDRCVIEFADDLDDIQKRQVEVFLNSCLSQWDEGAPNAALEKIPLPKVLHTTPNDFLRGDVLCSGLVSGSVFVVSQNELMKKARQHQCEEENSFLEVLVLAIREVRSQLESELLQVSGALADMMRIQIDILSDIHFKELMQKRAVGFSGNSVSFLLEMFDEFSQQLSQAKNPLLKQRICDIEDIVLRLLAHILGDVRDDIDMCPKGAIVVARKLHPSALISLAEKNIKALVLEQEAQFSHVAILAGSMGLPLLANVVHAVMFSLEAHLVVVDAIHGVLVRDPTNELVEFYEHEQDKIMQKKAQLKHFVAKRGASEDGVRLDIGCSVATVRDIRKAILIGADRIGLWRTEALFLGRDVAPSLQVQHQIYLDGFIAAKGKCLTIRLLDVGGDKEISYLPADLGENPMLGVRGVRLYEQIQAVIETQVQAICQAARDAKVKRVAILVPMVTHPSEIVPIKEMIMRHADAYDIAKAVKFGVMVEVPSLAMALADIVNDIDFVSFGTNDLFQYLFAIDRHNIKLNALFPANNIIFLRFIKRVIQPLKKAKIPYSVCGGLAEDVNCLPFWLACGFDAISVSTNVILELKQSLSRLTYRQSLIETNKKLRTDVLKGVDGLSGVQASTNALIDKALIQIDWQATDKEDLIRQLCDYLEVLHRTDHATWVEASVWEREDSSSTFMGHGIAVPHCKSEHIQGSCLLVVRLLSPILWSIDESMGGEPVNEMVDVIILMAGSLEQSDDAHLRVFANLARRLMHEPFRLLLQTKGVEAIYKQLQQIAG